MSTDYTNELYTTAMLYDVLEAAEHRLVAEAPAQARRIQEMIDATYDATEHRIDALPERQRTEHSILPTAIVCEIVMKIGAVLQNVRAFAAEQRSARNPSMN